ncbi:hypothetical protein GCM10027287_32930 [Bordetella muralis]
MSDAKASDRSHEALTRPLRSLDVQKNANVTAFTTPTTTDSAPSISGPKEGISVLGHPGKKKA